MGGLGMVTYLGLAYIPNCTHTHTYLWVGWVGGWAGDGNIPWTCIHSQLYAHTHTYLWVGWVGGWGGDGNIPWTCIHSQLYAHTHTYLWVGWVGGWVGGVGMVTAHKLHNCKNKVVHTANPFRVYRRVPCPRVQMRPLTACTDEAPTSGRHGFGACVRYVFLFRSV